MQPIRVAIRATDPAMLAELEREMDVLRGQEPTGAELVDDPSPRPKVVDPLHLTVLIAIAAGAGSRLGEMAIMWLVERIKKIVSNRKARVTLSIAGVELTVDEQTDPAQLATRFGSALGEQR